jgi:hypothetical protein
MFYLQTEVFDGSIFYAITLQFSFAVNYLFKCLFINSLSGSFWLVVYIWTTNHFLIRAFLVQLIENEHK